MDLSLKIDSVGDITPEEFKRNYFKPQKPLLIRGGVVKRSRSYGKWSLSYLKEVMGDQEVDIFDDKSEKCKHSAYTESDFKMKFSDYIDVISRNQPTDLRIFLFNGFKHRPQLKEDFPYPSLFNGFLHQVGFMFFGGKSTVVRMHQDIDMSNVLLTQFEGRKRVLLFSDEYSDLLYRSPFNTFSIVDMGHPDYEKYPGLRYVKGYDVILNPGDSLFMPSGYWHYITYIDSGFAVSYRKMAMNLRMGWRGIINMTVFLFIDKLMQRVNKEKWIAYKHTVAIKRAKDKMRQLPRRRAVVPATPVILQESSVE